MSSGGFLYFGDRNLGEVMVLDNSFQSIFKSLFKDMFECHENLNQFGIWYQFSPLSPSPPPLSMFVQVAV
jgi:hypothetical protein